ncbi:ABC transporter ATP-binding protein [Variovorax sp. V118]|uniref:ABC transporter ATP-binding protein n=1 Tax=Variovorax sp. V118 TaxID=3065954 RepID=UPI0034E8AAFC
MNVLEAKGVSIEFAGLSVLQGVSLALRRGEILAVIGPNGAGKTTLFNVLSGVYAPTSGRVEVAGVDISGKPTNALARLGLTRTFQNLQVFFRMSALENVMVGCHLQERKNPLPHLLGLRSVHVQNKATEVRSRELLEFVGLDAGIDRPAGELPYGALKRLEIARALAVNAQVLLLDEPVAGCNSVESGEISTVIRKVVDAGVSLMLVEHDMRFVMRLADRVHVLDRGKTLAEGDPDEIKSNQAVIEAYLGVPKTVEGAHA